MAGSIQTDRGPVKDDKGTKDEKKSKRSVDAFLKDCVKKFNRAESAESVNRQKAVEDLKFKAGDQWPEQIKATRTIERRPCLTINKVPTFVHQITNEQRQNRPSINVSPVGDRGDPETAKMFRGLIRQIERKSRADIAYDTGFESAVSMGWGYWRVLTDYEDEDTFDQVIRVTRIRNPFRVYLDPDHEEPDGSDAKWAFLSDMVTRQEFEAEYPNADPMAWTEGGIGDEYKSWSTSTHVRIAEYFYEEFETKTLVKLENGHVGYEEDLDDSLKDAKRVEEREVQCKKIKWCKLTAYEILEENYWPGKFIPIVKVIGDEIDIEGKTTLAGVIRGMKDAQRQYNFWVTSETEQVALQPIAPWIMAEGQIEGHEERWRQANRKPLPFLLYKPETIAGKPAPPPQRQPFAGPPTGVVEAKMAASQDMQATSGIRFDGTLQERMYDESGKALRELKRVADLGNYHYVDNLSRSLKHTGDIFIDLIPKVYDTKRILTILREDDTEEKVKIDPTLPKAMGQEQTMDGRVMRLFNPKVGDYEVTVTIGPSFATKRIEAADHMIEFMKVLGPQAGMIADLIAKNQDWPGSEEITARLEAANPLAMMSKKLDKLPPEARGIVMNMQNQMQQMKQRHDQAVAMVADKDKDRALDKYDTDKNFEAKVLKIMADVKKAEMQHNPEAEYHKIERGFEKDVLKVLLDHGVDIAKLESAHALGEAKVASGHMLGQEKNASAAELAKEKQASMPAKKGASNGGSDSSPKVAQALELLAAALAAPRETRLIRDENGKAVAAISAPATTTLQ